jgi:hypothetical protein
MKRYVALGWWLAGLVLVSASLPLRADATSSSASQKSTRSHEDIPSIASDPKQARKFVRDRLDQERTKAQADEMFMKLVEEITKNPEKYGITEEALEKLRKERNPDLENLQYRKLIEEALRKDPGKLEKLGKNLNKEQIEKIKKQFEEERRQAEERVQPDRPGGVPDPGRGGPGNRPGHKPGMPPPPVPGAPNQEGNDEPSKRPALSDDLGRWLGKVIGKRGLEKTPGLARSLREALKLDRRPPLPGDGRLVGKIGGFGA